MYRKFLLLGLTACLCGCVRPAKYQRPAPPVPNAWPDSAAQAGSPDAAVPGQTKWQEFFTEPGLQSVIQLALANNRDLRLAGLNVERVQAMYRIQSSQQYPSVGVGASRDFSRLPGKMSPTGEAQTVEQDDNLRDRWGYVEHSRRRIVLRQSALPQDNRESLLHEVFHAIDDAFDLKLSESLVRRLARATFATLRDSPEYARWLLAGVPEEPQDP
jgi:hypothetical protein